jgi:hypothetical protein
MANSKLAKKSKHFIEFMRTPSSLFANYFFLQVIVIVIYLGSRKRDGYEPLLSNGMYLGSIAIATLILTINLLLLNNDSKLDKNDYIFIFSFSLPIIILYLAMFANHDFGSMQSLTLLFILIAPLIIWKSHLNKIQIENIQKIVFYFSLTNTLFVILQVFKIIPVAQLNIREGLSGVGSRPTGILFNAFAMSNASLICFAIGLNIVTNNKNRKNLGWILTISSGLSLILSGTRTSLWLGFLICIFTFVSNRRKISTIIIKSIPALLIIFGAGAPIILLFIGIKNGNSEWATINGRTQMWSCVEGKISDYFPLGIGLDDAFPPQYCAESGWFSNLRHPENMFLLALVESGPIGFLAYVWLFIFTLWISSKAFMKRFELPLMITVIFTLSSLIYVPLFHYLPFLADRPADRGLFNFHFFYLIWIWVLKVNKNSLTNESQEKIRAKR